MIDLSTPGCPALEMLAANRIGGVMRLSLLAALIFALVDAAPASSARVSFDRVFGAKPHRLLAFPEGEAITVHWWGTIELETIRGGSQDVVCDVKAAGYVENGLLGGATQTIEGFKTSSCRQKGYCPAGAPTEVQLAHLPAFSGTEYFSGPGLGVGYRFENNAFSFAVLCRGRDAANIVGEPLWGYLSNGRYESSAPPSLDFEDGPRVGGSNARYEQHYGDGGNLELKGSHGAVIVQPKGQWYYLGSGAFAGEIIPTGT
jgi:hypothetical protein